MRCEYHLDVINTFRDVCDALRAASTLIHADSDLPGWMKPLDTPILRDANIHLQSTRLLHQLEYLDEQEGREILLGVGVFAVRQATLDALHHLNTTKSAFKYAIQNLKSQAIKTDDQALSHAFRALLSKTRHDETHQSLDTTGMVRLHLKQCYRQIPLLEARPIKVSWCWANTRSIKRISTAQALALLEKKGNDAGILAQIDKVAALPSGTPIAIVQELAPHLRTNVLMPQGAQTERRMLKGSLPLFYVHEEGTDLPMIRLANDTRKQENRPRRNDVKIDPTVYLPAIRGHLYI